MTAWRRGDRVALPGAGTGTVRQRARGWLVVRADGDGADEHWPLGQAVHTTAPLLLGPGCLAVTRDPHEGDAAGRPGRALAGRRVRVVAAVNVSRFVASFVVAFAPGALPPSTVLPAAATLPPGQRLITASWLDPLPLWPDGPVPMNPRAPAWWSRQPAPDPAPPPATAGHIVALTFADGASQLAAVPPGEWPAVQAALAATPGVTWRLLAEGH